MATFKDMGFNLDDFYMLYIAKCITRLKTVKKAQATKNHDLTVYDAFQTHISSVAHNVDFLYVTTPAIDSFLGVTLELSVKSSAFQTLRGPLREIINAFGQRIFTNEHKILLLEKGALTEKGKAFLEKTLQNVLDEHPLSQKLLVPLCKDFEDPNVFHAFESFELQQNVISEKIKSYKPHSQAYKDATELQDELLHTKEDLLRGKISIHTFKMRCETACDKAAQSTLKGHHGWKQIFANIGFVIASIVKIDRAKLISKPTTDSINKIQAMKKKSHDIPSMNDPVEVEPLKRTLLLNN